VTARRLALVIAAVAVVTVGTVTHMSAASFTASLETEGSAVTADRLSNHFAVTPGPDAAGDVDGLAIDLGLVAEPQTVPGAFTVRNVSSTAETATLTLLGPAQLASATFASSGTASATLAPGASSSVSLTTSSAVAGSGSGTLRLGLAGSSWLYRDYTVSLDAAPAAPASLTAAPRPGADIELSWAASTATANLAGYDVYRSTGGNWSKRNTSPVTGTTWLDTSSTNGTQYSYRVRAVSTDGLESLDSPTATARADSSAPTRPSAVVLANGGGTGSVYLNAANTGSVSVTVTLGSSSVSTDVVTVTLTSGGVSVSDTAPATQGAGTVAFSGIGASALPDGSVTISATASDAAGNTSSARTRTVTKDTAAPGAPTATYVDRTGSQTDRITGSSESGARITATRTVPSAAGPYTATAASNGTYTVTVAAVAGSPSNPITVTYLVTATDAAGNASAVTTLTYSVTR
jgi:Bacterial Ig domain/Bacterial Ig-like domain